MFDKTNLESLTIKSTEIYDLAFLETRSLLAPK